MMKKHRLSQNIPLVNKRSDVKKYAHSNGFVEIHSNTRYKIQTLTHSHPYLLPEAKNLLEDIACDFQRELVNRKINTSHNRIVVTSVFRSQEDVTRLRKTNTNGSRNSVHMYGTTFDVSYVRFANANGQDRMNDRCLKEVLAVVLKKYKNNGSCYVKYEKLQSCFHITVKERLSEEKLQGIDLSHHNTVTNWDDITASFVILKATEGMTWQDPKFNQYREEAQKRKIPVGVYHLLSTQSKIKDQFHNFEKTVENNFEIRPAIDIEATRQIQQLVEKTLRKMVREFADSCIQRYGCSPIIYTTEDFYKRFFTQGFDDCLFWSGDVNAKRHINCAIHQKEIRSVPGVAGKVDYDVLHCKLSDILLEKLDK
ncbi:MAG: DUF5715 family protein [Bacteroidales bacterium]|nr:DUF5715 family protein [Bacteroidales bacterium]